MNAGQWGQAYTYAMQAMALRESFDRAIILLDFSPQYETEALLRGGDERQARAEVHRLEEGLGPSPRFRIPYLQSLAVLSAWEGHREQAIGQLREAAELAANIGYASPRACLPLEPRQGRTPVPPFPNSSLDLALVVCQRSGERQAGQAQGTVPTDGMLPSFT